MDMHTTTIHGLEYPAVLEADSDVFEDISYGNDVTDKVIFVRGDEVYRLWVNDPDPEEREYPGDGRYILEIYTAKFSPKMGTSLGEWHDGWSDNGAWDEVAQTESPAELLKMLAIDRVSRQLDELLAGLGFVREGLGGNCEGYVKRDPTIGEITVTSASFVGEAPMTRYEQVLVTFTGLQHSEELLAMQLPLYVFVSQVLAARGGE